MLAIDERTSNDCAREMRGTASIDSAVIGRRTRSSTSSGSSIGDSRLTNVVPGFIESSWSFDGAFTPKTTSAATASPMLAPAST